MKGTFAFCRTKEAIKRLNDGEIIQNISNETYYRKRKRKIESSYDCVKWVLFDKPLEKFPPYEEWRSISNLHYHEDLVPQIVKGKTLNYLTLDDKIVNEDHPEADKTKKRWFLGGILL